MHSPSRVFLGAALALALFTTAGASSGFAQTQSQDRIYGSQLMTPQERSTYRQQMRNAKTAQERERIRAENHKRMTERAKERGVTLPDEPPASGMRANPMGPGGGMGQGTGQGMGQGMRPGGGMGSGGGRR